MRNSSPQVKQGLIAAAALFVVTLFGAMGGCWKVSKDNVALNAKLTSSNELMRLQSEQLATLRHANETLTIENSHYKMIINPIERKAKEIYPELETSAAIAKLAKDLEDTRNLAARGDFKAVTPETRQRIVTDLKRIAPVFAANKTALTISSLLGNNSRNKLGQELADILNEAGLSADFSGPANYMPEKFETPVRVWISAHGPAQLESQWKEMSQAISPLLTSGIVSMWNVNTTNQIAFQIMGTPAFLPNGSVVFE